MAQELAQRPKKKSHKFMTDQPKFGKLGPARLGSSEQLGSPGFRKPMKTIYILFEKLVRAQTN